MVDLGRLEGRRTTESWLSSYELVWQLLDIGRRIRRNIIAQLDVDTLYSDSRTRLLR